MDTGLKGKTALVTGGASGIGRGISLVLAEEGVNLAIASRNPDPAVIEEVAAKGVKVIPIYADLSEEANAIRMVQEAIDGLGHLDFYVNNAAWTWHQPFTKITSEAWYSTLNTNLSACMWACREVGKYMIARGSGNIVIIGSTVRFFPSYRETSYRVTKMGLRMLMQNLAIEYAPYGIRVNMVTPGHYVTRMTGGISKDVEEKMLEDMIPVHRFGEVLEIGNAVAFLLSNQLSGYTVGGDLVIDGGLTLHPLGLYTQDEISGFNRPD
jgi:NAD(P)-dependent dehydrogenase (short-subunit alcohol dehydrogenase family)